MSVYVMIGGIVLFVAMAGTLGGMLGAIVTKTGC